MENTSSFFDRKESKRVLRKRRIHDFFAAGSTYLFSSFSIIALIAIVVFVLLKGWNTLSWDFITGNYNSTLTSVRTDDTVEASHNTFTYEPKEGEYFASNWGIAFVDSTTTEGNPIVRFSYIDPKSNTGSWIDANSGEFFTPKVGEMINAATLWESKDGGKSRIVVGSKGAENMAEQFSKYHYLKSMTVTIGGGGIRGSLLSTLWLIFFALLFALPLGIGGAIYLNVYAKNNAFTRTLRNAIDMISGIPSIIFGLVGGIIFLPIASASGASSGNIITGGLTLACMILPIIIKSTEESIRAIPLKQRQASLALGASQTQTVFKVILPNALPGILTSLLLSIGRIIGESAALVYTSGTMIKDVILPTQGSATLAVHIWDLMSGETMNYEASCAVSIIILFVILVLSLFVKLLSHHIEKMQKGR